MNSRKGDSIDPSMETCYNCTYIGAKREVCTPGKPDPRQKAALFSKGPFQRYFIGDRKHLYCYVFHIPPAEFWQFMGTMWEDVGKRYFGFAIKSEKSTCF